LVWQRGWERTGMGVVWPRGGAREDAERRRSEGGEGEELTELTFADDRRGAVARDQTYRSRR
jgi:hypothetical protein